MHGQDVCVRRSLIKSLGMDLYKGVRDLPRAGLEPAPTFKLTVNLKLVFWFFVLCTHMLSGAHIFSRLIFFEKYKGGSLTHREGTAIGGNLEKWVVFQNGGNCLKNFLFFLINVGSS